MRRALLVLTTLLAAPACSFPQVVHDLHHEAPPEEFGRPGWVRGTARVGAWVGAVGGALVSIVALPVTYPVSLLADEPLGYSKNEFRFLPLSGGASFGHFLLGAPVDSMHYIFYRAWAGPADPTDYEFTPMAPPVGPGPEPEPQPDDSGS